MFSYSGDPGSSELDEVRFYVQDTDQFRPLLQDEEIEFLIAQWKPVYDSPLYVAAVCAEVISASFAAQVNVSADGINVDQGSLQSKYNDLAASLRDQYHALSGVNGPDLSSLMSQDPDMSITPLTFGVGVMDNARAGGQDYGAYRGPGHGNPAVGDYPEQTW